MKTAGIRLIELNTIDLGAVNWSYFKAQIWFFFFLRTDIRRQDRGIVDNEYFFPPIINYFSTVNVDKVTDKRNSLFKDFKI